MITALLVLRCRRHQVAVADSCIRWYMMFILLLATLALVLISGPDWIAYISGAAPFYTWNDWTCILYQFIFNIVIYAPDWLTFLSLIDRTVYYYYPQHMTSVCHPTMAKRLTALVFMVLFAVSVPSIWIYEVTGPDGCHILPGLGIFYTHIFPWISVAINSYLPTLLNLCLFLLLLMHVCRREPNRYTVAASLMARLIVFLNTPSILLNLLAYTGLIHNYTMMYLLGTIFQQLCTLKRAIVFIIAYWSIWRNRARDGTSVVMESIELGEPTLSQTTNISP